MSNLRDSSGQIGHLLLIFQMIDIIKHVETACQISHESCILDYLYSINKSMLFLLNVTVLNK